MCGCLAWRSEDAHSWWVDCKDGALPRGLQDGMFHGNFICTTATACVANNEMLQSETNSVRSPRFHSFPICSHLACPSRICSWSIVWLATEEGWPVSLQTVPFQRRVRCFKTCSGCNICLMRHRLAPESETVPPVQVVFRRISADETWFALWSHMHCVTKLCVCAHAKACKYSIVCIWLRHNSCIINTRVMPKMERRGEERRGEECVDV